MERTAEWSCHSALYHVLSMMISTEFYGTTDMGLSIALLCKGFTLAELKRPSHSRRVTFFFQPQNGIDDTIQAYWAGVLHVDAKMYWNESKNLKTRLYSLK